MAFVLDSVALLNLVLATAIVVLGAWVYLTGREKSLAPYVAVGFGLFAVSHALTLLGYGGVEALMLPLRAAGYLAVIVGLFLLLLKAKGQRSVPLLEEPEAERQ
ncbi:MAG TPA: hypothetical protein VFF30_03455 [Nitrososphaerales archaeon]|nr:hypothetical protein [Nitrososphaerales archaeon]